jgi:cytochrome P450
MLSGDPMNADGPMPVRITGIDALRGFAQFLRDPIAAMRAAHATHGPFVIVAAPLRIGPLRRLVALTAGARFNREVLSDAATWRPVHIMAVSHKDSAERRVGLGLFSMGGARHAHYRRLLTPPLRRSNVDAAGADIARLAEEFVDRWPVGQRFDLWGYARGLIRNLSIGLLFGDDRKHGYPIADLVDERVLFKWSLSALSCPFNLPITPYGRMVRQSEAIERRIVAWAGCKRGNLDGSDLLSIIVNNPDENGDPPSDATFVGHVPSLFVAGYDTCRTALIWTLVLLAQHPRVARKLADELEGTPPSLDRVRDLPLLDAVVKESMRLLPPVPMQIRIAQHATALGDYPVPMHTRAVLSAFVTNRLPDLYPDPDRFQPERWATINPSGFEYAIFSGGPRICPGQWFGLSVLKIALAAILTRYRVALEPNVRIDYEIQPTLAPRSAVPALLKSKRDAFASAPLRGGLSRLVQFPAA